MSHFCAPARECRAGFCSILLHSAAIAALFCLAAPQPLLRAPSRAVTLFAPAKLIPLLTPNDTDGGGGGGNHSPLPVSQGQLPRASDHQFVPPSVTTSTTGPMVMEATLLIPPDANLPQSTLPYYGDPLAAIGPPSDGPGKGGGQGNGDGNGVGDRKGPGYRGDSGQAGITGRRGRGVVSPPQALFTFEPDYTDEARKAHVQGMVELHIDIDEHGIPRNIRVVRPLGMGLDERAKETVAKWKFRPATRDGKPFAASAVVQVNFRLL